MVQCNQTIGAVGAVGAVVTARKMKGRKWKQFHDTAIFSMTIGIALPYKTVAPAAFRKSSSTKHSYILYTHVLATFHPALFSSLPYTKILIRPVPNSNIHFVPSISTSRSYQIVTIICLIIQAIVEIFI